MQIVVTNGAFSIESVSHEIQFGGHHQPEPPSEETCVDYRSAALG